MNKSVLAILVVLSWISLSITAQTVSPSYFDGEVYVKLVSKKFEPSHKNKQVAIAEYDFLKDLEKEYGIYKIERPFRNTKSEKLTTVLRVYFENAPAVANLIRTLEDLPVVEYSERVSLMKLCYTPNDPSATGQNAYHLEQTNAYAAFDITQGSRDIRVAIVDDACDVNHTDLAGALWTNSAEIPDDGIDNDNNGYIDDVSGWDVANDDNDPNTTDADLSHGTHVAGIAGADTDNGTGVASLGFKTNLIPIRATNQTLVITDGYEGLTYAADIGADVVNLSWGGDGSGATELAVINYTYNQGTIIVAAAGNSGNQGNPTFYPAAYDHVIAVAALNVNDTKANYSEYGEWVDISAYGTVYSTVPFNNYQSIGGTSQASPMVAGLCGLMLSLEPTLSFEQIQSCLKSSSVNVDNLNAAFAGQIGAGKIDAGAAVLCVQDLLSSPPSPGISSSLNSICPGETIEFSGFSTSGLAESYFWQFPGGEPSIAVESKPNVSYAESGTYDVTLLVQNDFGESTMTFSAYIAVEEQPQIDFEVEVNGLTITVTNNSSPAANSYFWKFGDGGGKIDVAPTHTYSEAGEYEICVDAFADCPNEACQTILVEPVGIESETALSNLTIAPNPVNDVLTIEFSNVLSQASSVEVYDLVGKLLVAQTLKQGALQTQIPLGDLTNGMYLVKIQDTVTKIIKQ